MDTIESPRADDNAVNLFQALSDARVNPFGAQLLAESLLKSPISAQLHERGKPLCFFLPIERGDCPGWAGVEFNLKPIKVGEVVDAELTKPSPAAVDSPIAVGEWLKRWEAKRIRAGGVSISHEEGEIAEAAWKAALDSVVDRDASGAVREALRSTTTHRFESWTPAQRAVLVETIAQQAMQIEGDAELRSMVDWLIDACGLQPCPQLYRLALLSAVIVQQGVRDG
ncbi:MAG TPA: hypothetical protein VGP22_04595 [Albitalea sp.]|jgi:hypothetical protein|nr:hypothetical protein [Albitalea sp.]